MQYERMNRLQPREPLGFDAAPPSLPKEPFILADLVLVAMAIAIAFRGGGPLDAWQFLWVTVCVVTGALLFCVPYLIEHRWKLHRKAIEVLIATEKQSQAIRQALIEMQSLRRDLEPDPETTFAEEREKHEDRQRLLRVERRMEELEYVLATIENHVAPEAAAKADPFAEGLRILGDETNPATEEGLQTSGKQASPLLKKALGKAPGGLPTSLQRIIRGSSNTPKPDTQRGDGNQGSGTTG